MGIKNNTRIVVGWLDGADAILSIALCGAGSFTLLNMHFLVVYTMLLVIYMKRLGCHKKTCDTLKRLFLLSISSQEHKKQDS